MNVKRAFKKNNIINPLYLANNGLEALQLLESGSVKTPLIIILDINMPKMNGIEFLQRLRANDIFKSITVFVMTTSDNDKDKIEAYNLNVAGYILKPLSFEKFISTVAVLNSFWQISENLS